MNEIPWPAVGVISGMMVLSVTLLGFYIRYLIQTHILTCPYPKQFRESLNTLIELRQAEVTELKALVYTNANRIYEHTQRPHYPTGRPSQD